MPNRILRDGINSSPRINRLSMGAEILYRRLMSIVDDYGRFHAAPVTIRGACWPTCPDKVTERQVAAWLAECSTGERCLIHVYESDSAKYLQIDGFGQHVRTKSKFPQPADKMPTSCAQSEIILRADCEQNVGTSRSSYCVVRSAETQALGEIADRMYALHPKKRDMTLVIVSLEAAVVNRGYDAAQIEACHAAWCQSEEWTEQNARYCPPLPRWISDDGFTRWPEGRQPPAPPVNGDPASEAPEWDYTVKLRAKVAAQKAAAEAAKTEGAA